MAVIINGNNTPTAGAVAVGDGTTLAFTAAGTSGQILKSNGASVPTWINNDAGTVTSVAATVPSVFNISGSPITSSGTLALTYSGTALPVANGGTGLTAGTSGGILAYTGTGTLASSGALTQYGVVIGGGAGAAPTSTAVGTATHVLTSNGAGVAPTFQAPASSGISTGKAIAMAMIFGF